MTRSEYLMRREALSRRAEPYDLTDELADGRTITCITSRCRMGGGSPHMRISPNAVAPNRASRSWPDMMR